ncbi:MAG TPA: hypothetical protein VMZ31_15950 [Phycisphaerae bacterium]|nr:hypothetical protein [Phycisphaerae bacterium]
MKNHFDLQRVGTALRGLSLAAAVLLGGCGPQAGAALYWMGVGQGKKIKAQFTLTKGPLAVFVDDPSGLVSVPEATTLLITELDRNFRTRKVNTNVVSPEKLVRVVYSHPESQNWSIRQVGEKLGAEQVLHIRVRRFRLHDEPGDPLYKGQWQVTIKVVSTQRQPDVRLWPKSIEGHDMAVVTSSEHSDDEAFGVELARRMARMLAQQITFLFCDHTAQEQEEAAQL